MCHPNKVTGQSHVPENAAYSAAAYAAARGLMLDLLTRLILDPDDPESEAELRSFLNARAGEVRAERQDLLASLPGTALPAGNLQLVAGPGTGELG